MTTISEAIFKGRIRREAVSPDSPKRDQTIMTSQLLARRAVEAVLAGGYTRADDAPEGAAPRLAAANAPADVRGMIKYILIWLGVFALAGAIAIGTSRLPGHAVHAKQADRSALDDAAARESTEVSEEAVDEADGLPEARPVSAEPSTAAAGTAPAPQAPVAAPLAPAAPVAAQAAPSMQVAAQPAPANKVVALAQIFPVKKQTRAIAGYGVPDDRPLGSVSQGGAILEEVIYEAEPVNRSDEETGDSSQGTVTARKTARPVQKATKTAGGMEMPKVEGIFWDKVRPMAIVGGDIVEVGGQVGSYEVVDIRPGVVTLQNGNSRIEVRP